MDTRRERGEPERREGLGGRVRRFVDDELSRVLDKDQEGDRNPADRRGETEPYPAVHRPDADRSYGAGQVRNPDRTFESDRSFEPERHQEPVTARAGEPDHADRPAATTPAAPTATPAATTAGPADPGYHTPTHHEPPVESAVPDRPRDRSHDQAAADGSAERIGLLNDPAGLRAEWQQVQATFVDDPHRAVREAGALVERTLQEIHRNVTRAQSSDPSSTEDLRVSFQRYREFFQRLLSA